MLHRLCLRYPNNGSRIRTNLMTNERYETIVDVAGAVMGGARRWLAELDGHGAATSGQMRITGRDQPVGLRSLLAREAIAARSRPRRVVATNNLSFWAPAIRERFVLVRNALHFLDEQEVSELGALVSRPWEQQAMVIRRLLRRATLVIVPSTSMANRVRSHVPSVADKIVVRFHPVSPQFRAADTAREGSVFRFLCPVLDAPFKRLDRALDPVLEALDAVASRPANPPFCLEITMDTNRTASLLTGRPWLVPIGRLSVEELGLRRRSADALVYPTSIESFGYPLAEARAEGRWVLAPATPHNAEVAGPALVPYSNSAEELCSSIEALLTGHRARPEPDPSPFSAEVYFDWLLSGSSP